jgi:hypothetical protein
MRRRQLDRPRASGYIGQLRVRSASLSALGASSAVAQRHHHAGNGAQKAPLFEQPGEPEDGCTAGGPPGEVSGFAVLNTADSHQTVIGEVSLKGGAPNTTYEVILEQHFTPGDLSCAETSAGTLTTNGRGNGNQHISVARVPGTTTFSVELETASGGPEFVTSEVALK